MTHRDVLDGLLAAWRDGDAVRSVSYFSLDAAYHESSKHAVVGRTAILELFAKFFRDGPAWQFVVENAVFEGDHAALRYRFSFARNGSEPAVRDGCAFVTFRDGTIAEWREYQG